MTRDLKSLSIVVPCYNEEEIIETSVNQLLKLLKQLINDEKISKKSFITIVDDGSSDSTWEHVELMCKSHGELEAIKLSSNSGHQNALLAGLFNTTTDMVITIDADLQDDISAIPLMVEEHYNGHEVVYGVRSNRDSDSLFKKHSAQSYYSLLALLDIPVVFNHADYRLLGRRVIQSLTSYKEVNMFMRGLIPALGYKSTSVYYKRNARTAGTSKYPLMKMMALALNGVTSHSMFPLRLIAVLGITIFACTVLLSLWVVWIKVVTQTAVPGWASSTLPIYLLGGLQLLCLGIVGEYIGKIYLEAKGRPRYLVDKHINNQYGSVDEEA